MQIGTPAPPPSEPQGRQHLPPGVRGHERTDANVRLVFWIALSLAIGAVVMHAALFGLWKALAYIEPRGNPPPSAGARPDLPPEPRLQIDEEAELARLRALEDEHLSSYGWIDKTANRVRIPVSRAMELAAERGLPKWGSEPARKPGEISASGTRPEQETTKTNVK